MILFFFPVFCLQSCSRILLDDKLAKDYLKKMRAPKTEPLKKAEIMKSVVKKCTAMAGGKAVKCSRCGYLNGLDSIFFLYLNIVF